MTVPQDALDDALSDEIIAALRRVTPPLALEARVVASARSHGVLGHRTTRWRRMIWVAGAIAAMLPLVIAWRQLFDRTHEAPEPTPSAAAPSPEIHAAEVVWF